MPKKKSYTHPKSCISNCIQLSTTSNIPWKQLQYQSIQVWLHCTSNSYVHSLPKDLWLSQHPSPGQRSKQLVFIYQIVKVHLSNIECEGRWIWINPIKCQPMINHQRTSHAISFVSLIQSCWAWSLPCSTESPRPLPKKRVCHSIHWRRF